MKLIEFSDRYPDEASCERELRSIREKNGIVCSKCGNKHHWWVKDKKKWICSSCRHETGLRSGTVMHSSKLPLCYWFISMHLLTATKKSFSAVELQRQLGHKRYQPIWEMLHKLRSIMNLRDGKYDLFGTVELDEGFFTTTVEGDKKEEKKKRGRGSQSKTAVLVMAESQTSDNPQASKKYSTYKSVGHIKMIVIPDLKAETETNVIKENVNKESELVTDASTSYVKLKTIVAKHSPRVILPEEIGKTLPWVHIAISNAKRLILNTYHSVNPEFLQGYLDEFCYKFNRRYFGERIFDRLLLASSSGRSSFKHRIY